MGQTIPAVPEFYAHALAIEREAVQRYREFEAYFTGRGDEVLAGLCLNLAVLEEQHLEALRKSCEGMELPAVNPAEHGWLTADHNEAAERAFYRVVDAQQLLEIALRSECNSLGFFQWVATTSPDESVRALANDMAMEEMDHVKWVRNAIEYHREPGSVPAA
jgi:rubrerythrin